MTTYQKPRPMHLRTTTYRDFLDPNLFHRKPAQLRPNSPTRRSKPHPEGLHIQRPYNKHELQFQMWNPEDENILEKDADIIEYTRKLPDLKYDTSSNSRSSYGTPEISPEFQHMYNTTRFGCRPYRVANGIVPHVLPSIYSPAEEPSSSQPRE